MDLHNDFEGIKGLILHCSPLFSVVVSDLLAEKIQLQSYSEKKILFASNPSILVVLSKSFSNNQNKPYIWDAFDECNFYKQKGH